jgi:hypothetical protein
VAFATVRRLCTCPIGEERPPIAGNRGAMGYTAALAIIYACVVGMRGEYTMQAIRLRTGTASRVVRTLARSPEFACLLWGSIPTSSSGRNAGSRALVGFGAFVLVAMVTGAFQDRWIAEVATSGHSCGPRSRLVFSIDGTVAVGRPTHGGKAGSAWVARDCRVRGGRCDCCLAS